MYECTRCKEKFEDDDSRILRGCPSCGWKEFLYLEEGEVKPLEILEPDVESIKIIGPGRYEVNLKKLLEEKTLIFSVKDGRYIIHLPSLFRKSLD